LHVPALAACEQPSEARHPAFVKQAIDPVTVAVSMPTTTVGIRLTEGLINTSCGWISGACATVRQRPAPLFIRRGMRITRFNHPTVDVWRCADPRFQ